jgi:hypothetical protein
VQIHPNGMLQSCFNSSPFEAINAAYPNKFKPWELPKVPICFWNSKENCIAALKWVTKEKLKLAPSMAKKSLRRNMLRENGLALLCGKYTMDQLRDIL